MLNLALILAVSAAASFASVRYDLLSRLKYAGMSFSYESNFAKKEFQPSPRLKARVNERLNSCKICITDAGLLYLAKKAAGKRKTKKAAEAIVNNVSKYYFREDGWVYLNKERIDELSKVIF